MSFHKLVKEELSGSVAKSYVAQISRFHRIQASTMFHESAEYVKNELQKIGLNDAVIEQFPADGTKKILDVHKPSRLDREKRRAAHNRARTRQPNMQL